MTRYLLCGFALLLMLGGCTLPPTAPSPPVVRPEIPPKPQDPIEALLDEAAAAFEDKRLTTPLHDNAHQRYLSVLAADPGNARAREGINNIVEKYLAWALASAEQGNLAGADRYVSKARQVDETHPNIGPVTRMIDDRKHRQTATFRLDPASVRHRRQSDIAFARIAEQISQHHAFVTIRAADDASGRWLYQQLNERVNFRIEARFEQDTRPSIVLTYRQGSS